MTSLVPHRASFSLAHIALLTAALAASSLVVAPRAQASDGYEVGMLGGGVTVLTVGLDVTFIVATATGLTYEDEGWAIVQATWSSATIAAAGVGIGRCGDHDGRRVARGTRRSGSRRGGQSRRAPGHRQGHVVGRPLDRAGQLPKQRRERRPPDDRRGAVEQQTAPTGEIGRSVCDAARGTSEIARNIAAVALAARDTAANAAGSLGAADELAAMAAEMRRSLAHFRC